MKDDRGMRFKMKARGSMIAAVLLVVLIARPGWAVEVVATGEAEIDAQGVQAAEDAALGRALSRAVEKVVGITVESDFSMAMREVVKGNESRFNADVRDSVLKHSEGFIAEYDVLEKARAGQRIRVRVRADVYESKVKAEIEHLAELIKNAGDPRVMVVIQEVIYRGGGKARIKEPSELKAKLEQVFKREGFRLQGTSQARKLSARSVDRFDAFQDDRVAALELARSEGADILIAGRIAISDRGVIGKDSPIRALVGKVKVEVEADVRALLVSSGEVLSPAPIRFNEMGSDFSGAVLRIYRGSRGRGYNVVERISNTIIPDIKERLSRIAQDGRTWLVELRGVQNYRRQGRAFLSVMKDVPGVSQARERNFADGRLEIEVECRCTQSELQNRVFDAVSEDRALGSLDLAASGGGRLTFKL